MTMPPVTSGQQDQMYYFLSAHRSLKAAGIHARLSLPVNTAAFHAELSRAFSDARASGITRPVLMGAIPFDMDQPPELFIPSRHSFFERSPHPDASRLHASRQDKLVAARSLPDAQGFQAAVQQAVSLLRAGKLRKAVLSRICELDFSETLAPARVFHALCAQNPHGYPFQLPLSGGGHLLGVSPELLLQKDGARVRTFPLAGSARRLPDAVEDQASAARLLASAKDHYEHQLVIEDIRRQLTPHCAELSIPATPSLLATRAMWHLGTPIEGRLTDPAMTSLQLACLLHPTPAICGSPTTTARELIREIEPFQRGVFSGMVGWCDEEGNGEWAVTIRCATLFGHQARLFAGAGIVEASTPEAEWAETEAKLGTMLAAFGVSMQEAA